MGTMRELLELGEFVVEEGQSQEMIEAEEPQPIFRYQQAATALEGQGKVEYIPLGWEDGDDIRLADAAEVLARWGYRPATSRECLEDIVTRYHQPYTVALGDGWWRGSQVWVIIVDGHHVRLVNEQWTKVTANCRFAVVRLQR